MRYPSPVPTQRADYKSAEVKAIALWSRERWCLAYHHRIERNRVYLTACSVACVLCILFAMRRREGQGGAPHKMIGPSDGGRRRLLYRLYFNADGTCNTKEKKSWIEIRTSRAQPKLFMGGENFPFFSYGSGIDFLWYPKRLGLSVLIWNLCKTDQTFFWHLTHHSSLALGKDMDVQEELRISPWILHIATFSHLTSPYLPHVPTAPLHCENLLLAKGEMGNSFHLAEFVDLDFFFFSSLLLAESLTFLWNVNASLTRPYPKHFLTFGTRHVTRTALQFNRLTIEVHALNFHPFQIFCWF